VPDTVDLEAKRENILIFNLYIKKIISSIPSVQELLADAFNM
jgi:hypothetical protein